MQLQAISSGAEEALNELTKNMDSLKSITESQHQSLTTDLASTREQLKAIQGKCQSCDSGHFIALQVKYAETMNELDAAHAETNSVRQKLTTQLTEAENRVADASRLEAEANKLRELSQQEFFVQAAQASDNMSKYQREVVLHAADVQALTAVKEELDKAVKAVSVLLAIYCTSHYFSLAPCRGTSRGHGKGCACSIAIKLD